MALSLRSLQGNLQKYKKRKWKTYLFRVTGSTYLHYFAQDNSSKAKEEVFLMAIKSVTIPLSPPKGGQYVFEVRFRDKCWILSAPTSEDRKNWMETIYPETKPRAVPSSVTAVMSAQGASNKESPKSTVLPPSTKQRDTRYTFLPSPSVTVPTNTVVPEVVPPIPICTNNSTLSSLQKAASDDLYTDSDGYIIMSSPDSESVQGRNPQFKDQSLQTRSLGQQHKTTIGQHHIISSSCLANETPIGQGNFGQVCTADYSPSAGSSSITVAVKILFDQNSKDTVLKEFAIMASMMHPNIVRLYGIVIDSATAGPRIVMEYLPHGDLKTYLKVSPKKPVGTLVKYMIDIAMGMHYIAQKGLIHRDLAARNVLVGEGETCKVSDFGLIKELPSNMSSYQSSTPVPLPIRWMSPEALSRKCFSEASDVWSYGVLQWEMFNPNELPYKSMDEAQVVMHVIDGNRLELPDGCPPLIARIIEACWQTDRNKRPSFLKITSQLTMTNIALQK